MEEAALRTAVVMMTHRFDQPILEEFQRIRAGLGENDQAFLLSDGSAPAPPLLAPLTHTFDYAQISRRAARVIGQDILRNVHLAWLDFCEAQPGFAAYWFIEYDVVYSGPWKDLFDAFRDLPHDLLCTHLRPQGHEPDWFWWPAIHAPGAALAEDLLLRGFLPIARLSRRGVARLREAVDAGWSGFHEGLLPTLFHTSGLRIGDLGGDGPFVPAGFRNRFYTSVSDPAGSLFNLGTMRFRPPIHFPRIMPGRLYHPVKPGPNTFDAGVDRPRLACAALGQALGTIRGLRGQVRVASVRPEAAVDHLLQLLTGLGTPELRAVLDRMAAAGVAGAPLAALRQGLLALPTRLHPDLKFVPIPLERGGAPKFVWQP